LDTTSYHSLPSVYSGHICGVSQVEDILSCVSTLKLPGVLTPEIERPGRETDHSRG